MKRPDWKPGDDEALLDSAWQALEQGDPYHCLELVNLCHALEPARHLIASRAFLDLGERESARAALAEAKQLGLAEDEPDWLAARGELALAEWEIEFASDCFRRLCQAEPSAYAYDRLALCADLSDHPAEADHWLEQAHLLEPEQIPLPRRISHEHFGRVIESALADLDPEHQRLLESTPIVVEPLPFRELAPAGDPLAVPPDALGLFVGPSLVDEASGAAGEVPPAIYLFQRNLERMALDEEELEQEIRTTLYHEIGHRLGYDEGGVDELGLG